MDKRNNNFTFDFTPIGQAIKKARETRGMTREQLANIRTRRLLKVLSAGVWILLLTNWTIRSFPS